MPDGKGSAAIEERRQHERVPARIAVQFSHPSEAARVLHAYSLNFSVGGLCLRTRRTYEIGEPLRLELQVDSRVFRLSGAVAWIRPGAVGVRFTDVTDEDRERLEHLVAEFRR